MLVASNPLRYVTWCLECFRAGARYTVVPTASQPSKREAQ